MSHNVCKATLLHGGSQVALDIQRHMKAKRQKEIGRALSTLAYMIAAMLASVFYATAKLITQLATEVQHTMKVRISDNTYTYEKNSGIAQ